METNGVHYTLKTARLALASGKRFGDIYPLLEDVERDGEALKAFFVLGIMAEGTPSPLSISVEVKSLYSSPEVIEQQYTGNTCTNCLGVRLVRNGTCELCLECGTTSGCS